MTSLRPVVLSGGSGTRLWPLSQPDLPKQFAPLFDGHSLFGLTLERVGTLGDSASAIVVTGDRYLDLVRDEARRAGVEPTVIVEPIGRNTTAAIVAAALVADPDEILVVLPSDHLIADDRAFSKAVAVAAKLAAAGDIVTFGIEPVRPETGYGYIEVGEPVDGGFSVARFKEKPQPGPAAEMAADGKHLWNSGMFVVSAAQVLAESSRRVPALVEGVTSAIPAELSSEIVLGESFADVESISFDYSIMEATDRAVVVPFDAGWDDVGSYQSLLAASEPDDEGNHFIGDVKAVGVTGSYIAAQSRRVVVAGVSDLVVVETPDEVLVVPLDRSQEVRTLQLRDEPD